MCTRCQTQHKASNGSRILILGVAYKPNIDDERESPSYVSLLAERGAEITIPYVPVIKPVRDKSQFVGRESVAWNRATIESFDLVLIATNHSSVNYHELGEWARCNRVYAETRSAGMPVPRGKVWKRNQGHRGLYGLDGYFLSLA